MAVVGLPGPGVTKPVQSAPPLPSAALRAWVAQHYAQPLRAGVLKRLAANPTRAQQLLTPTPKPKGVTYGPITRPPVPVVAPDPYAAYPAYAQQALRQMDADKTGAMANATAVNTWLGGALAPLQAANATAQQNYVGSLAGIYGGGAGGPPQIASSSPGGIIASPTSFAVGAGQQQQATLGQATQASAAVQGMLGSFKTNDIAQGALANAAWQQNQIPTAYAAKKADYLGKIGEALASAQSDAAIAQAKLDQDQAQFNVTSGLTERGQTLDYTLGLAKLAKGSASSSSSSVHGAIGPFPPGTSPPDGYSAVSNTDGTVSFLRAPRAPAGSSGGAGGTTKAPSNWYAGAKRPELIHAGYVATPVSVNGRAGFRYIKAGKGTAGAGGVTTSQRTAISSSFAKLWNGSGGGSVTTADGSTVNIGGAAGVSSKDPATATTQVVNFIHANPDIPLAQMLDILGATSPKAKWLASRWWAGQINDPATKRAALAKLGAMPAS